MKRVFIILLLIAFGSMKIIMAQSVVWEKTYGFGAWDRFADIIKHGQNYYLVGTSGGPTLTKLNDFGDTLWHKEYDISLGASPINIKKNHRGNFIVFENTGGDGNTGLFEVDTNGTILWMEEYNTSIDENNGQMLMLPDGGAILIGDRGDYTAGFVYPYAIRVSHNGSIVWDKTYSHIPHATGVHISPLRNGGFIISGRTGLFNDNQMFQLQINVDGDTISSGKIYTGVSDHDNFNARIVEASDSSFLLTANILSSPDSAFLARYDSNFNLKWIRYLSENFYAPTELKNNEILIHGTDGRGKIAKFDWNGNKLFEKTYRASIAQHPLRFVELEFDGNDNAVFVGYSDFGATEEWEFYAGKIDSIGLPNQFNKDCSPPIINNLTASWDGDTVILDDSASVFLQYNQEVYKHWYLESGSESFADDLKLTFDQSAYPDSFWVSLVVSDGIFCTDTITIDVYSNIILDNPNLGVGESRLDEDIEIVVYPNPNDGRFWIDFPRSLKSELCQVEIYNLMGEKVYDKNIRFVSDMYIDCKDCEPGGIYVLRYFLQSNTCEGFTRFLNFLNVR